MRPRYIQNMSAVVVDEDTGSVELYAAAADGTFWRLDGAHRASLSPNSPEWTQLPSLPPMTEG